MNGSDCRDKAIYSSKVHCHWFSSNLYLLEPAGSEGLVGVGGGGGGVIVTDVNWLYIILVSYITTSEQIFYHHYLSNYPQDYVLNINSISPLPTSCLSVRRLM